MAYKSLFSVITDIDLVESVLAQAKKVCRQSDAHLEVLCMGVDRSQSGYYYAGANAMILQEAIGRAQGEAEEIESKVRETLGKTDLRWSAEAGVAQLADIGRHVAARARFSDLVVLPRPYGKNRGVELEPVLESALFEGHTPVLVVPDAAHQVEKADRIILGWNESAEALNAARAALPVLKQAQTVHVVVVDPPAHGPNRSDPGGLLSQYLARHGVKIEIDVLSRSMPRVSDIMLRHCKDINADMVVMGAYGHSRFREAIMGGATRYMLEQSEVPVLMAH